MTLPTIRSWRRGAAGIAAAALAAALSVAAPAAAAPPDTTLEWYDATAAAVATGTRPQVTNSRAWAISWLAAARAARTTPAAGPAQDAALASAVHTALSALLPQSAPTLDATLRATLDRIPDGRAKDRAVAAGQREARALLDRRADDGLDPAAVNPPYPAPEPAPGVWQPTPPAFTAAQQAGTRFATPFLLDRADRYRPGPPPAPGSPRYRADLAEVGRTARPAARYARRSRPTRRRSGWAPR
ncbi:hypothetical protein [Micromonospora sp. PLK6-60]|uniref:hypothetical protein n=1 Tax=Micromonospora sp. PLK6-60 TaxID=2873383 RepID=UPI002107D0A0|nr:hypothetical protein [Micromonospora sp. PLK6-60]